MSEGNVNESGPTTSVEVATTARRGTSSSGNSTLLISFGMSFSKDADVTASGSSCCRPFLFLFIFVVSSFSMKRDKSIVEEYIFDWQFVSVDRIVCPGIGKLFVRSIGIVFHCWLDIFVAIGTGMAEYPSGTPSKALLYFLSALDCINIWA